MNSNTSMKSKKSIFRTVAWILITVLLLSAVVVGIYFLSSKYNFANKDFVGCENEYETSVFKLNSDKKSYYLASIGDCTAAELIIPAEFSGLPVTAIGNEAFANCTSLASVTIPESVKAIGHNAFLACSRVGAIYYNAIEVADNNVGTEIFSGVGFDLSVNGAAIHIGAKVKRIPEYLFDGENFWTKGVTFADGCVCEVIAEGAFLGAFGMSSVIPVSVKEIGSYAFFSGKKPDYYDTIQYAGTMSQWGQIRLGSAWNGATVKIKCSDGTIGG